MFLTLKNKKIWATYKGQKNKLTTYEPQKDKQQCWWQKKKKLYVDGKGVRVIRMNWEVSFIKNSWGDDDKDPDTEENVIKHYNIWSFKSRSLPMCSAGM